MVTLATEQSELSVSDIKKCKKKKREKLHIVVIISQKLQKVRYIFSFLNSLFDIKF